MLGWVLQKREISSHSIQLALRSLSVVAVVEKTNVEFLTFDLSRKASSCLTLVCFSFRFTWASLTHIIHEMAKTPAAHLRLRYSRYWDRSRYIRYVDWILMAARSWPLGPWKTRPWKHRGTMERRWALPSQTGLLERGRLKTCHSRTTFTGYGNTVTSVLFTWRSYVAKNVTQCLKRLQISKLFIILTYWKIFRFIDEIMIFLSYTVVTPKILLIEWQQNL